MVLELFVLGLMLVAVYSVYKIITSFIYKKSVNLLNHYLTIGVAGVTALTFPELAGAALLFLTTVEGIAAGVLAYFVVMYAKGKNFLMKTAKEAGHDVKEAAHHATSHDSHGGGHDSHDSHNAHDSHAGHDDHGHGGHDDHAGHDNHGAHH